MSPYTPIPRYVSGEHHSGLIRRLLRKEADPQIQRIDLITTTRLRVSVIDSGLAPAEEIAEGDTCIHVLWQRSEEEAHIRIGGERFEIAPGDSTWIPAGDSWELSGDQLAILIAVRSSSLALPLEPQHGEDRFTGNNRQTVPHSPNGIALSRWKLTGPLDLPAPDRDLIVIGLFADVAIRHDAGVSMLQQGGASVIRPGSRRITLVPNGLSYVLALEIN